jgi:hypothetical protein
VAQAQDRRREKVVEELANQELGGIGGSAPPAAAPAAAPPPPPKQDYGRYAQNQAPTPSEPAADETANSNVASAARDNSPQAGAGAPSQSQAGPQRVANTANLANSGDAERKESASLLAAVHEQIRQGRCLEANLNLQRLEQSPATTSAQAVSEARRDWQRTCQAQLPAGNLERQLQQPMPAAQAPSSNYAPPRASAPMSKSAAPQRAKKAAPAKAKAADFAN